MQVGWSLCCLLSGLAALIYEVLWMRLLGDWLGNSVIATQIVLAVFFGGMALGAAWATRWVQQQQVKRYVTLELIMACFGALSPWLFRWLSSLTLELTSGLSPTMAWLLQSLIVLSCLLLPTLLMGATVPLLVEILSSQGDKDASEVVGWVAFWNTLGAALGGGVVAAFLPLWLGVKEGIWVAASCNAAVAALAWWLFSQMEGQDTPHPPTDDQQRLGPSAPLWRWWGLFALSGFCALSYEVLWTRALMAILGNSTYSFSAILGVYLLGLALGGGAWRWARPKGVTFASLQALLACLGLLSLWMILALPGWETALLKRWQTVSGSGLLVEWVLISGLLFLPCLCIGMLFPAMIDQARHARKESGDHAALTAGQEAGWVSFATTFGGVLAPVVMGLWWMPLLGVKGGLLLIACVQVVMALLASQTAPPQWQRGIYAMVLVALVLGFGAPSTIKMWQWHQGDHKLVTYKEGVAASLAVVQDSAGRRRLKLNNRFSLGGASGVFGEGRQGHLPRLLVPQAQKVMVLGVGSGNTLSAVAAHPSKWVTGVEIVPGVLSLLPSFASSNQGVWRLPHVRLIADDARHVLATSPPGELDLIIADLFHSYRAGVGGLYTKEHFMRGRKLLRQGGVYFQWIPLYQLTKEGFQIIVKTFVESFPEAYACLAYLNTKTPALGLLGAERRLSLGDSHFWAQYKEAKASLRKGWKRFGVETPLKVLSMMVADRDTLKAFAADAPLNTENHPLIELQMPWARWRKDWSGHGVNNLQEILRWHQVSSLGPLAAWLKQLPPAIQRPLEQRLQASRIYLKSRIAMRQKQPKASYDLLMKAAAKDATWALPRQLLSNIASAWIKKREHKEARAFLEQVVRVVPTHEEAWTLLGSLAYLDKKPREALRLFQRALSINPQLRLAQRNLALLALKQKQPALAANALLHSKWLKDPNMLRLLYRVGLQLAASGSFVWLKQVADRLVASKMPLPRLSQMAGYARLRLGEPQAALPFLRQALRRKPKALYLHVWLIQALAGAHQWSEAESRLTQASVLFPGRPTWIRLGQLMKRKRAQLNTQMGPLGPQGPAPPPTSAPASKPTSRPTHTP